MIRPLTDLGRRQALLTARRIARRARRPFLPLPAAAPHAIVHSPLARAAETAALIGRAVSSGRGDDAVAAPVPLHPDPGLLEIGQGEWEGIPGSEVAERWGPLLESWRHDPLAAWAPGGESLAEVDFAPARPCAASSRTSRRSRPRGSAPGGPRSSATRICRQTTRGRSSWATTACSRS